MEVEFTGKLLDYKNYRKYSDMFVETGTAAGDGIQRALDAGFDLIDSCEAANKWFQISLDRFKGSNKVELYKGKSTDFLEDVVSYSDTQVIFLDAHSAGPESFGHQECITGIEDYQQENIIKTELNIILNKYNKHVIIIDDVNGLTDGHAEEYMEIMSKANLEYKFSFWDENLSGKTDYYYKDKLLVAIP